MISINMTPHQHNHIITVINKFRFADRLFPNVLGKGETVEFSAGDIMLNLLRNTKKICSNAETVE